MDYTYSTQLSSPNKNDLTFVAMIADLTNSISSGEIKNKLDRLYETERAKGEQLNSELLKKYSNNL
jgi:hypothetical protein